MVVAMVDDWDCTHRERERERERERDDRKLGGRRLHLLFIFFHFLHLNFFILRPWNPSLFIEGGRGKCCL
jgi:hypothetical protein